MSKPPLLMKSFWEFIEVSVSDPLETLHVTLQKTLMETPWLGARGMAKLLRASAALPGD